MTNYIRETFAVYKEERQNFGENIVSPKAVVQFMNRVTLDTPQESFYVLLLDIKKNPIGWTEVARGVLAMCLVDASVVFRTAIVTGAAAVVLIHNHPSGDPSPSTEDIVLTQRLQKAGEIINITVVDHIIITTEGSWFSFMEKQWL